MRLDDVRTELRSFGAGGALETGVVVVGLDARGREITHRRVTSPTSGIPRAFAAFLAIAPDVVAYEFRHAGSTLYRAVRPATAPVLESIDVVDGHATWTYRTPASSAVRATVEVRAHGGWSPVVHAKSATRAALPLGRVRPCDGIRVVATDGWNTDVKEMAHAPRLPKRRVVARYAGHQRWWADTDDGGHVVWSCGDRTFEGRAIVVPPGTAPSVRLAVRDHGEEFIDVRTP